MARRLSPAVFLDRDGVVNESPPAGEYVTSWQEFRFIPGVQSALAGLRQRIPGVRLVIITNQRGIATGAVSGSVLADIHLRMGAALAAAGAALDGVYVCPHDIGTCVCRKPETGLIDEALRDMPDIDRQHAVLVGDSLFDIVAGSRAELKCFLVGSPQGRAHVARELAARHVSIAGDADSLADLIAARPDLGLGLGARGRLP
jgi:D-glycero-D-manno-heptose 1,7-bisphosphate phosphatase